MKPVELTLCGWGPYREKQKIDFRPLTDRGLFLITGATGAGKTTVFDAVVYALYGSMSGETREKNSVRSDFADNDTPTYVEFSMEHEGKRYHIKRNPEYLRPKKRKSITQDMTREKENAVLTMPDGSHIEGSSEVTRKIQEILCLDVRQFKQLSMIAQGEFTRLLTAPSAEKSKIFREIFDTDLYDKIAAELKKRSSALYKQVMEYRHKLEEDLELFVPMEELKEEWRELTKSGNYYYQGILDFLKENKRIYGERQKELERKAGEADMAAEKLAVSVTEGEQTENLLKKLENEREKYQKLESQKAEIEKRERQLKMAEKAALVKESENRLLNGSELLTASEKKLENVTAQIEKLKKEKAENSGFYERAEVLFAAYEKEEKEQEIRQQLKQTEISMEQQQKELSKFQEQYLQIEVQKDRLRADYETADKRYRHGIAGILANNLTQGEPCPVCGSLSHPGKAVMEDDMPTEEEVEKKKALFEKKGEELTAIHGKTAACRERGDVINREIEQQKQSLSSFEKEKKEQHPFVKEYLSGHSKQAFLTEKKEYEALLISLGEKEKSKTELMEEYEKAKEKFREEKESFEKERRNAGFENEADYRLAFLKPAKLKELREYIQKYKQDCHACEHLICHLQEELSERKQVDVRELKEELAKSRDDRNVIYGQLTRLKQGLTDMTRLYDSLREKTEKSDKLSVQYGLWKDLDDAANGNNKKRLVFEQFVLTAYFDEILKAANLRLKVMTGGRYELKRMETVGDGRSKDNLDMEVLDYYTGKYRSVKTLSGGETFKVSLSLALGMSDMVQALSGGIRVDTLFIDEGFGSLDSESLEQACQMLHSLVEKDRLIGIISHVPELTEKIESKIRVHKTSAGSTIEIVV
ncbi:MAG: AAA family ATPase [Suilimivivens sp.]